jgi:ankyrin repeat protein
MDYKIKYIKYKNKYLDLKRQIGGSRTSLSQDNDLYSLCIQGSTTKVQDYLDLELNKLQTIQTIYNDNDTILHKICYNINKYTYGIMSVLLDNGATSIINKQNSIGYTPLHIACLNKNAKIINLLLDNGADINISDNNKDLPLHILCKINDNNNIQILLRRGSLQSKNAEGKSPLMIICELPNPDIETVRLLLRNDANRNDRYNGGESLIDKLLKSSKYYNEINDESINNNNRDIIKLLQS